MDRESMGRLRFDRRLQRRRGWIEPEEIERELEQLPDASEKVAPPDRESPRQAREGAPSSTAAPPTAGGGES